MRNFGKIWENKYHIFILIFPAVGKKSRSGKKISRKVGKKITVCGQVGKKDIWENMGKIKKIWEILGKDGNFFSQKFFDF